jgi:hypothetical protein
MRKRLGITPREGPVYEVLPEIDDNVVTGEIDMIPCKPVTTV